jgi:hypothetical protein
MSGWGFIILILGLKYRGEIMRENKTAEEVREYKDKNYKTLVLARSSMEGDNHMFFPYAFTIFISNYQFLTIIVTTSVRDVDKYILNPLKALLRNEFSNTLRIIYVYKLRDCYRINIGINE